MKKTKKTKRPLKIPPRLIRDLIVVVFGAFLMGGGIGIFLVDAKVVPGGVSGLSMATHYVSGGKIPVGLMIWLLNIPLFVWGVRELGSQFGVRTFVGFTANAFFIDLFRGHIPGLGFIRLHEHPAVVQLLNQDFILAILVGGVLTGVGLGIIFKFRGSTGGSDILAAVAQKRWGIKPGMTFMVVDCFVILFAGIVIYWKQLAFHRPAFTLTLYALFLLFISSRIVDFILDGFDYARSAMIISPKFNEIAEVIMKDLSRGATALEGRGLYKNQRREILYTVLSRKEIGVLVDTVKRIDPNAFIIINNVHEVLGQGFRPRI